MQYNMKLIKITILTLTCASFIFFSGCLKDKDYEDGLRGIKVDKNAKFVEVIGTADGLRLFGLNAGAADTSFGVVTVRLASNEPAASDIQVTLALDPTLVDEYNNANGTSYTVMPANLYSISNFTVTIPKGSREGNLMLKTVPNSLIGSEYALGFKLTNVSDPSVKLSGNFNNQVAAIITKNEYDGYYRIKGVVQHPSLGGWFTDAGYPCGTFSLITAGGNSVDLDPAQPYGSNGTIVGIFGVYPRFTIDPATHKVSASDAAGTLSSVQSFTDYDSRFDPASKTLYIKWGWNGSRIAWDTLVYCGPR